MKKIFISIMLAAGVMAANAQDVITKRNGDEINAKVTEINSSEIKYKKYGNENGPTYTIAKSEVFMIKYENGDRDVFKEDDTSKTKSGASTTAGTKGSTEYKKNAFGLDIGLGGTVGGDFSAFNYSLGFRYLHNFNPYFGVDFVNINVSGYIDAANLQFMSGVRGYSPRFYKNMCAYGSFKLGGCMFFPFDDYGDFYSGFCLSPEIGVHITKTFFVGVNYNYSLLPKYPLYVYYGYYRELQYFRVAAHNLAFRIGFNF